MKHLRLAHYLFALIWLFTTTACDFAPVPNESSASTNSTDPTASNSVPTPLLTNSIDALKQSLNNTKHSTTYRMSLNFMLGTSENGQLKEQPFLNFDAEINSNANRVVYTGGAFNEILGGGERIEIISIPNKTYLKGSNLFGTAEPDQWYLLVDSTLNKPPFDLGDMLSQMADALEQAKVSGTDQLDSLHCQTWLVDFKNKAGALIDLASTEYNKDDFNVLDRAEARITPCADGFVHALTWNIQTHNQKRMEEKGLIKVSVHLFDFKAANIDIKAPDSAIELK